VLTYPFPQKDYTDAGIRPGAAWFSAEKSEFFIKLSDVLAASDPAAALHEFLKSGYEIFTRGEGWENSAWHEKPLLYTKGSSKL
jgi:hypothetical protein